MCCVHVICDVYDMHACDPCVHVCCVHKSLITFFLRWQQEMLSSFHRCSQLFLDLFCILFSQEGSKFPDSRRAQCRVFSQGHPVRINVLSCPRMFSYGHFSLLLKGHQESHVRVSRR